LESGRWWGNVPLAFQGERMYALSSNSESSMKKLASIELRNRVYEIIKQKSFRRKRVTLSSGKQSDFYFDMKPTMLDPEGATKLAQLILFRLKDTPVERIGGLELGAVPLISPIGTESFLRGPRPVAGFFVRKKVKEHGTQRLIEGDDISGKKVVILDDVTTTGGSAMLAVRAAQEAGAKVLLVLTIVDREEGAKQTFEEADIPFHSLFTASEFLSA
jgi:orotate phosphoribosyltransferase